MTLFGRRDPADPTPLWRRYLRFHRADVEADVEDELRFHLEMSATDLERRGHDRSEAERLARARFGEVSAIRKWLLSHDRKRQHREERADVMDTILLDLKYAMRKLRHQPGFTLGVVLVLGLGIGAATTMFSAVDAALLRPLPFQRDDRLMSINGLDIPLLEAKGAKRMAELDDARAMRTLFTHVAAYAPGGLNLSDVNAPMRLNVALMTPDLFATLGVPVARGRGFAAEEGKPDAAHVAVLSDGLWRRQFGADPSIIGRDVRLNDVAYRVVGVMPPRFGFPEATEIWLPLTIPSTFSQYEAFRSYMPTTFVARLAPGVEPASADAALTTLIRRFQTPERRAKSLDNETLEPLRDVLVGKRRTALLVLLGATGLVLLVACANVTNLLLSRAIGQRSELALRAALGASRGRIVRQLLAESVVLALAGGFVGVLLAYIGVGALGSLMPPSLAGAAPARVDARVLMFSTAIALMTGLAAGLWPALGASHANPSETIKSSAQSGTSGREGMWTRRMFVVAELALALMLAVGSGLMLRSLQSLLGNETGVNPVSVATLELTLPQVSYPNQLSRRRFFDDVIARALATPGVEHAAVVNELPLRGKSSIMLQVLAGLQAPANEDEMKFAQLLQTTPDYFQTLGIPLLRGRTFSATFDSARAPEVVISESMAKQLWRGEDPIGGQVGPAYGQQVAPTVVGVVGDVRPWSIESEPMPQMYLALANSAPNNAAILARGSLAPTALAARLREAVRAVNPTLAVYNVRPMTEVIAGAIAPRRTNTYLITLFGDVAVLLAAIGVYGVIAYGVARRTREIGIRMALGAQRNNVIGLVVSEGIVLAVLGVSIGLASAWALRRLLASLLYGVTPSDPAAYVGAAVVLLTVAVIAALVPARRALLVDPALAMRAE
ncbi:MAG: ABC transporter permease [bacterium]